MKRLLLIPSVSINAIPLYFLDLKNLRTFFSKKYYAAVFNPDNRKKCFFEHQIRTLEWFLK